MVRATNIVVCQQDATSLEDYASVPSRFVASEVLDVESAAGGAFVLKPRRLSTPISKDYDAAGEHPSTWSTQFGLSDWIFLAAFVDGVRVGGAVVADGSDFSSVASPETGTAVLWDIRVHPDWRRRGVGTALFDAATRWAATNGYRRLSIETQNINVPACWFYARRGCVLVSVNRGAYLRFPDEVQLLWCKDVT